MPVEVITIGVLLLTWVVLTLVLPIVSAVRASHALREAARLREQLAALSGHVTALREQVDALRRTPAPAADPGDVFEREADAPIAAASSPVASKVEERTLEDAATLSDGALPWPPPVDDRPPERVRPTIAAHAVTISVPPPVPPVPPPPPPPPAPAAPTAPGEPAAPTASLETRIGANWLLYVGIATLVLGASYFIKYAFENNWVTPQMRVLLGLAGGIALVEAGRRFARSGLHLYGQMLAGGGIVILYVAIYAAFQFYALVDGTAAFTSMIAVTALAAWRADREQSQALALLAVIGGFATPFLVGGDSRTPHVLFAYAAILIVGTLWLASRHDWPALHLVTFILTGLTVLAWVDGRYTRGQWLSLELWLTLFAALFIVAWRSVPRERVLTAQLTRAALSLTPLIYHVASLSILWRQTAGLMVYLIAVTAAGITAASHLQRAWIRLVTWALVGVPALGWLSQRPARWDTAVMVALGTIYALHLAAQIRETSAHDEQPRPIELLLLHLNGLWLWAGLAIVFEKLLLDRLGAMTFGLAAWYLLLGAITRPRHRETALHLLALAGAFVAAGVAIELDGAAVTVAWAVEGAAIVALALATGRAWLQAAGGALLLTAGVRLAQELLAPAAVSATPLVNVRTLSTIVVVALVAWLANRIARSEDAMPVVRRGPVVATLVVAASILLLLWASAEVDNGFARSALEGQPTLGAGAVTSANLARDVALSTLWAGFALVLIAIGIRREYAPLRILAILILGVTVTKVFLVDLSRFDRFYRILSTVGLGLLLLGSSYLYQRFTSRR